ncbi:MAG: hypothetical protein V3V08_08935 [Nannocystaceae bacterium]
MKKAESWAGSYEATSTVTEAKVASWKGAQGTYLLALGVEGCKITGRGRRIGTTARSSYDLDFSGTVGQGNALVLKYQAVGRRISGTWNLNKGAAGLAGSFDSDKDDSSGGLTLAPAENLPADLRGGPNHSIAHPGSVANQSLAKALPLFWRKSRSPLAPTSVQQPRSTGRENA